MDKSLNISSKYQDIISKSLLLRSGSPSIYQLEPKKKTFGTLTKLTVGERDVNKVNKTILLVGETRAGKSTLINALVNHTMGVKWEDEVWFQIVEEKEEESQTSDVIVYQVCGFEGITMPYSLTIIDTPGFGDTRGVEHDVIITERLFDWFRSDDGFHEINAVGLVMKASVNRVSDRLMYIFDSVMSLFGKNIEKNIVALITHSNGMNPENVLQALEAAKIKCARNEKNQPVHFLFDNCLNRQRTKKEKLGLETAWRVTHRGMKQFMTFLEKTGPQKLNTTVEVMNDRVKLTACIQNLQERINFIELKQMEIRQTEEALKKHKEEKKKNKDFTVEVDEVYSIKEGPEFGLQLGFGGFNGALTYNAGKETRMTRRVKKTLEDITQKYEHQYLEEREKKSSLLENLKTEMNHLEADRTRFLEEAYQHVVNLDQIALKADSVSTNVHLDFLIEKMKEKGDTEKVQKLEEMKKREDTRLQAAVQYGWSRMKSAGKAVKGLMK